MASRQFKRAVIGACIAAGVAGLVTWGIRHKEAEPPVPQSVPAVTNASPAAGVVTPSQPTWGQLSAEQHRILAPLVNEWDAMENVRRKKWLGIAERYARMSPKEQERVQARMREWVELTPQQRRDARNKFASLSRLPPEKREAVLQKWQEYENLPEEEKERLTQAAKAKQASTAKSNSALPRRPGSTSTPPRIASPAPQASPPATEAPPPPTAPPNTEPAPPPAAAQEGSVKSFRNLLSPYTP